MVLELIRKLGSILEIRTMDLSWLCVDDFKLYESGCSRKFKKALDEANHKAAPFKS